MKQLILLLCLALALDASQSVNAQVFRRGGRMGARQLMRDRRPAVGKPPTFKPVVYLSLGYALPNLDKRELPGLSGYYRGNVSQMGPVNAAVDYRFTRRMSIGVLVTYGTVKAPYLNSGNVVQLNSKLSSWGIMLNFMRYLPVPNEKVLPYIRTAIGINSWKQQYFDVAGNPVNVTYSPEEFAYQVGFGARFQLSKNTGCFIEAGYGKYILSGGVALKL